MLLRNLINLRRFSTTRVLRESLLSANYKSVDLWNERFKCPLLGGDESVIRSINHKIVTDISLNSCEVDIFVNIASPDDKDAAQLREALKFIKKIRRSIAAHTILPSTHHAICRLFLYSLRLDSLMNVLEDRVNYGIFPDFFSMNLLLNEAIDKENFALASRLAVLVMLQEEFGFNPMTDVLSMYSVAKYIESKTEFSDWIALDPASDEALPSDDSTTSKSEQKQVEKSNQGEDDEEEEEDQYIRIPFLRNEYNDNHFDLNNPRLYCGKTLKALGKLYESKNQNIYRKCTLLGQILLGKWTEVADLCRVLKSENFDLGPDKAIAIHYIQNLGDLTGPEDPLRDDILTLLDSMTSKGDMSLSTEAKSEFLKLQDLEKQDIEKLRNDLDEWSKSRHNFIERLEAKKNRDKLIEEIKSKKEELRLKEQYLYFFENLKKKRLTRIDYE